MIQQFIQIAMGGVRYGAVSLMAAVPAFLGWDLFAVPAGLPDLTFIQVAGIVLAVTAADGMFDEENAKCIGEFIVRGCVFIGVVYGLMRLLLLV